MLRRKKRASNTNSVVRRFFRWIKNRLWDRRKWDSHSEDPSNRLKVYLFNVGQGDHILLELPNGEYGIIDFYYEGQVGLKEPPALTYLENVQLRNPKKTIVISFICLSHPDFDHVKGVDTFLKWVEEKEIKVKNFWLPAGKDFPRLFELYEDALRKYKDKRERDKGLDFKDRLKGVRDYLKSKAWTGHADDLQGAIRSLDADLGGVEVVLIAPLTKHIKKFDEQVWRDVIKSTIQNRISTSAQPNLMSSVLLMILNKHKLLFGGDTGLDVWLECLNEFERTHQPRHFGQCRANFIKVSHHGSKNSSSVELWSRIMTKNSYLAISAGKRYGHPHAQTLRDIYHATQGSGTYEVVSTNICTRCLIGQDLAEESIDELIYRSTSFAPQVVQGLNQNKPSSYIGKRRIMTLGAYIFRFSVNSDKVKLTKGLFPTFAGNKQCIYNNQASGPFPHCAQ